MEIITSRRNPLISDFRRLAGGREERRSLGLCLGQGYKLLTEAIQNHVPVETVLYCGDAPEVPAGIRLQGVSPDILAYVSPMKSAPELLFSCRLPENRKPMQGRILLAENMQDPGNVGTMIRTAAAFGFDGILLAGACADPWGPKAVRASMGAVFRLTIWEETDGESAVRQLRDAKIPIYAAALSEETLTAGRFPFPESLALAIGNEGHGLSETLLRAADKIVRIPMAPGAESLNAAAAAAVLMWEVYRGRENV